MKNIMVVTTMLLFPIVLLGQWEPDVRLTNDPAVSYTSVNNAWCVATSGSNVHVVWNDERDGNFEIYYKRSLDNGTSWETDTRLTYNPALSWQPSVAVSGSNVHVVWFDERDGGRQIYYKRSLDNGTTWSADIRLTYIDGEAYTPSVAVSGSNVHVVWMDWRSQNQNYEIYYKRSLDDGTNWETETRLTYDSAWSGFPSVAVSGSNVHVVWHDSRDGGYEVYYKRSWDNGTNWETDTRLTYSFESSLSSVAVSGSNVHVVWHDERHGSNGEIYYKRSLDNGTTWSADIRLTNNIWMSMWPSVAVSDSNVHVVWHDSRDGGGYFEIYYKRSWDNGTNWETDTRLTYDTASSYRPSVAISDSNVHVVWADRRDGNDEIYYKHNPTGNVRVLDVGVTQIIAPSGTIDSGTVVIPKAAVQNFGVLSETFSIRFIIGTFYSDDTAITLANGVIDTVEFASWTAIQVGTHTTKCTTLLNGDSNPTNDFMIDSIRVRRSVEIDEPSNVELLPKVFVLGNNSPNPFASQTSIRYALPKDCWISLQVYNSSGFLVRTLRAKTEKAGFFKVIWNGCDEQYKKVPKGVYFYRLEAGEFTATKKMVKME